MKITSTKMKCFAFGLLVAFLADVGTVVQAKDGMAMPPSQPPGLITTTTESVEGRRIRQYLGIVRGVTVRQPTIGQSMKANLKGIVGGKMSPFTSMCETARTAAYEALVQQALALGANAVVGLRYDSSAFGSADDVGTEVVCYGTAVILEGADDPSKHATIDFDIFGKVAAK